jgi:polygalacturonase
LPGAVRSPLYTVTVKGISLFVEKLTKFSPEMQVHYAHCSLSGAGAAEVSVTVSESFNAYTVSPKSRNLLASKSGNTITFSSGPNYLILQFDSKELLFILLDPEETNPPHLGDPNVKNIADYTVDATGAALETTKIQTAINAASGATQDILYFPPGKYKVGELWLKSNMTLYLAGGAVLYGSNGTGDFNTGSGGIDIEGCSHGMIRMYQIQNTKILGRGVIDANGKAIRAQNDTKINLVKIEGSSNILIDGVLVRDPSFWNTLIYRSDLVTIQNYKMINCRPTTTTYNNTDGVNFDESTNGRLYNAFLYTGDDSMATKNEEPSGTINTRNIVHEKVVCYSNSVGCKIGTKTMGQTIDGVVFRDIDVVKAGRALNIDAYDTAVVQNTRFENIRIEAADASMIALEEADPPTWRDAANQSIIRDTYFTNISSDSQRLINLHGRSATYNITGVHFRNVTVRGQPLTSQTDADATWSINSSVSNITFD